MPAAHRSAPAGPRSPIFITGAPRSGTTLCAQILNAHSQVTIFDEINVLELYDVHRRLRRAIAAGVTPPEPVLHGAFGKFIRRRIKHRPLADLATQYETCREFIAALLPQASNIGLWGEKMPSYFERIHSIKFVFPESIVIFLVRHPAAVIASYLRYRDTAERTEHDYWITGSAGNAIGRLEEAAKSFLKNRASCHVLRYEDLAGNPRAAATALCHVLGIEFEDAMLDYRPRRLPGGSIAGQFHRGGRVLPWKSANLNAIDASLATRWQGERLETLLSPADIQRIANLALIFQYPFAPADMC